MTVLDFKVLSKRKPKKELLKSLRTNAGRSKEGKLTVRHKGAGHKRRYRIVDFKMDKFDIPAKVKSVEYDPYRSAFIALVVFKDGEYRYIVAPDTLKVGNEIVFSLKKVDVKIGNRTILKNIPDGTFIYNLEYFPNKGAQLIRSAGEMAQIMAREGKFVQVKLPSGEVRNFLGDCFASIGQVSNFDNENIVIGKAGRKRWMGIRPTVTGKSMNPVDHPHGGGEGHTSIGLKRGARTKWGKPARGVKTRKVKKSDSLIIKRRK